MASEEHLAVLKQGVGAWNRWRESKPQIIPDLRGANLQGASLQGAYLSRANLHRANLREADLTGADLQWADLTGADLQWADLTGADLQWANLTTANLSGADLQGADLSWTNLHEANLRGANLQGADLRKADLTETKGLVKVMGVMPGNRYWKRFEAGLRNNGYQYRVGRNDLRPSEIFASDERELCAYPGFHFASHSWCSANYPDRPLEAIVRIPDDAQVNEPWATDGKASASAIIIEQVFDVATGEDVTDKYR